MLADELVAGREVEDDVGPGQRQTVAGRRGGPEVFAHLDAEPDTLRGLEQLGRGGDDDGASGQIDLGVSQILSRGEPALFVELVVVGQIGLGHDAEHGALLQHDGTVEQQVAGDDGHAHDADDVEPPGVLDEPGERLFGLVEQQLLPEEVLTGVAGQTEFGETDDFHALSVGLHDLFLYFSGVVVDVGYFDGGHSGRHFDESVGHIHFFLSFSTIG